jgi:WD40 repeat protein
MKTLNPGGEIQGVAFSPNGTTVAIMSWNIELWDIATDKELGAISFSDEKGFSVSFSHDGQLLAYGDGQAVKIWNVNTGSEFRSLSKHSAHVDWVAFSPNGKTLASSSDDRTIKIWDMVTGAELRTLRGHTAPVHTLAFSRDGKLLASTSVDKTIRIWDAATGSELKKIVLVSDFPGLPAFSPDGRMLICGSLTGRTYLWDVSTGTNLASFIALDKNEWVVMTPDGRFDGSTNGLRFLHSVQDNKPISLDRFEDLHTPKLLQQVFAAN